MPLRRVLPRSLLQRIDDRMDAGDVDGDDASGGEVRVMYEGKVFVRTSVTRCWPFAPPIPACMTYSV